MRSPTLLVTVWGDLLDRSASTWNSQRKAIEIAKIALPAAAGAVTTFGNLIERFAAGVPLHFLLPGYLLIAALASAWVIHVKQIPRRGNERLSPRYRFPQELRYTAKAFLPIFIFMFGFSVSEVRPNVMRSERAISGVICSTEQKPVIHALITAVDKFGRPSSKGSETTDDDGYFYLELDALGLPASELRVSSSRCTAVRLSVTAASLGVRGCRPDASRVQPAERTWVHTC